jgi:hypothetical protein
LEFTSYCIGKCERRLRLEIKGNEGKGIVWSRVRLANPEAKGQEDVDGSDD